MYQLFLLCLYLPTPLTHNNTQQHYTTALRYIKLPMYQLFVVCLLSILHLQRRIYFVITIDVPVVFMALVLNGFEGRNLITRGIGRGGLRSCHFRAQKSLTFQGPPLPMPLIMMLHPSKPLCTAP